MTVHAEQLFLGRTATAAADVELYEVPVGRRLIWRDLRLKLHIATPTTFSLGVRRPGVFTAYLWEHSMSVDEEFERTDMFIVCNEGEEIVFNQANANAIWISLSGTLLVL